MININSKSFYEITFYTDYLINFMNKKIAFLILVIVLSFSRVFAIEEVHLEQEGLNLFNYGDYLSDVYYGKVENAPAILKLASKNGLEFENSFINSVKFHFLYSGDLSYIHNQYKGDQTKHLFNSVEPKLSMNFNDNKTQAMFNINLVSDIPGYDKHFAQMLRMVYISHRFTPNQMIVFGQYTRVPTTYDGAGSLFGQDAFYKTQLGRTFGNTMSVGVRNIGNYKYIDYDIGLYDSTRFMQSFGKGLDFTGYLMFKPLADFKEKIGDFRLGAGYNVGKYNISYNQYSFFAGYDYKKFHAKAEYAAANGYNGIYESRNSAEGFYTTLMYDITSKLTLIGRYDVFDKNIYAPNDTTNEYTVGLIYSPYKNIKFLLNYVITHGTNQPSSNSILFATRFIL